MGKKISDYAVVEAADLLAELIRDRKAPATVRLKAAEIVLNRVYGRDVTAADAQDSEKFRVMLGL